MSTHNIGFYEDLTKIIFELSSNIIKYAPYFFYCKINFASLVSAVSVLVRFPDPANNLSFKLLMETFLKPFAPYQ